MKVPYICSALTKLPADLDAEKVKAFHSRLGDVFFPLIGVRAFVPHEHYDPVKFAHFNDTEVYFAESEQIRQRTSLLVMVNVAPTTGGGAEVALAGECGVPVIFLSPRGEKISRYVTGLTKARGVFKGIVEYSNPTEATLQLRDWSRIFFRVLARPTG